MHCQSRMAPVHKPIIVRNQHQFHTIVPRERVLYAMALPDNLLRHNQ